MSLRFSVRSFFVLGSLLGLSSAQAAVLPDDRADVLGHVYDGGGGRGTGPALLVPQKVPERLAGTFSGDVDMVSSASIDVLTSASPYKEQRKQWSTGLSYLRGKTTYSANFLKSDEPDYKSDNASFDISEDMFGDLTTVT